MIPAMRVFQKVLFGIVIFSTVSACARFSPSLIEQGIVQTEIGKSDSIRITRVTVYREDGMTVVRGEAAFPAWKPFGRFTGHIDIDIVAPEGDVLKKRSTSLIRKRRPRKRSQRAYFVSRFAIDPPKGTIVQVAYHQASGTHD